MTWPLRAWSGGCLPVAGARPCARLRPQSPGAGWRMDSEEYGGANGLVRLLDVHRAELLRFLTARCGSVDDAEEVLQDLWFKVSGLETGPITNRRAYLFRMD